MNFFKFLYLCLFNLLVISNLFSQEDADSLTLDCQDLPELLITEITDDRFVSYTWDYKGAANFYILEYKGIDDCVQLNISDQDPDDTTPGEIDNVPTDPLGIFCPPDVWTVVPVPTLKTQLSNSTSNKNANEFSLSLFLPCILFEFRMKVVCNNDTLYSNVVPYLYSDGNCPDCLPERTIISNHETDITIQTGNRITSNVDVMANVTYIAGERIELKKGFSTQSAFNFHIKTESCPTP